MVDVVVLPDLEEAEIGLASSYDGINAIVYSTRSIIEILMERDGMGQEEAIEYFYHNILAGFAPRGNPMFLDDLDDSDDPGGPDDPDNDTNPVKPGNQVEYRGS